MATKYDKLCTEIKAQKQKVDNKIDHWWDKQTWDNVDDCEWHIISKKQEVLSDLTDFIESLDSE